jgi:hypothetical protein
VDGTVEITSAHGVIWEMQMKFVCEFVIEGNSLGETELWSGPLRSYVDAAVDLWVYRIKILPDGGR